jgi:DNA polymerase-3 subunit gamma/tau
MALEMTLVRLARRPPLLALDELLARVGDLERRLAGAPPPAPAPPRGGGGGGSGSRGAHAASATMAAPGPLPDATPATRTHGALALVEAQPPVALVTEAPRPAVVVPMPRVAPPLPPPGRERSIAQATAPVLSVAPPSAAPSTSVATAVSAPPDLDAWRAIVDGVRRLRPPVASVFEHAMPLRVERDSVVVGFEASAAFLCARANETEALEALTQAARSHFGAPTRVEIDGAARSVPGARTLASIAAEQRGVDLAKARAAVEGHPVVRTAMRLFDAQLRDVRLPGNDG